MARPRRYQLTLTDENLRAALRRLEAKWGDGLVRLPVRLSWHEQGLDLLVPAQHTPPSTEEPTLLLWHWDDPDAPLPTLVADLVEKAPCSLLVGVGLGTGLAEGQVVGLVRFAPGSRLLPLDALRLQGASAPHTEWLTPLPTPSLVERECEGVRSRVIGALGAEQAARLAGLHVALVGCGGLGSELANLLARLQGAQGQLTLVDPDRLERANLGAWRGGAAVVLGQNKAEALGQGLTQLAFAPNIETCPHGVETDRGRAAVKQAELLVCAVDRPLARLWCGLYAALYRKPLLVLEAGAFVGQGPQEHEAHLRSVAVSLERLPDALLDPTERSWLADIRLILPGAPHGGCLLCAGGTGGAAPTNEPFWRQRAGTLPHGNAEVAGRALRLLLSYLQGGIHQTTHLRLDDHSDPTADWYTVTHTPTTRQCPLCALLGQGDSGLTLAQNLVKEWQVPSRI